MTFKRILAIMMILICATAFISAQTRGRELTVEESYLQQSIELMIIREQSRAESREMKVVALEYINDAIQRGNTSDEIRAALEYLGIEGTINQTRENGRLVNNYPDIRMRAATYLGDMGTPEAKTTLIKMCLADNEPMVLTEVVKSLGRIGINDNEEATNAIAWIVTRYDVLNPDNLLALSALEAFEKLAAANNGITDSSVIRTVMRIADGPYIRPVQQRARETLATLRQYNAQNSR